MRSEVRTIASDPGEKDTNGADLIFRKRPGISVWGWGRGVCIVIAMLAPVSAGALTCPVLARTLKPKSQGSDVTALQTFLSRDQSIYPEAHKSGYYGTLTTLAVQRFQARHHIVDYGTPELTGWGVAGPATRAAMMASCARIQSETTKTTTIAPGVTVTPNEPQASAPLKTPELKLIAPLPNTRVGHGNSLAVSWSSTSTPVGAAVALWLTRADTNETIGLLAQGLSVSDTYRWRVPAASGCGVGNPLECIAHIAGRLCPLDSLDVCPSAVTEGSYRIVARVYTPSFASLGRTWTSPTDAVFVSGAVGAVFTVAQASSSLSVAVAGTATSSFNMPDSEGLPGQCQYVIDGKWYPAESRYNACCTSVTPTIGALQCAAATSSVACPFMRCVNGYWLREDAYNLPPTSAGSCTTPWGGKTVLNGQAVGNNPYFSNGSYALVDPQPRYVCHNGSWSQEGNCADDGPGCYVN